MATWCLIKEQSDKFKKALRSGDINPQKLADMSSGERRSFLEKFVGKDNAPQINSLFESKLLLKNQKAGMISWAKKVGGLTKERRTDLIAKIERLDKVLDPKDEKAFLQDLASDRLGVDVSATEAKTIFDLAEAAKEAKSKANENSTFATKDERLNYGWSQVNLENYINDLKLKANKISVKNEPVRFAAETVKGVPGFLKSALSSLDNSYFGRQGIKTLLNPFTSHLWAKNFIKSWGDIGKELIGRNAIDAIKSDIYSRPNALNGKYKALGKNAGLSVFSEEAFPSALPGRIPLLGRLYKASESAYNGGALRLRADLADRLIKRAEKHGIDVLNKKEGEGIGTLIGSTTGRGSLGRAEGIAGITNNIFFSIKFLKSNFDTLTAHQFDSKATKFSRAEARKNLLAMTVTTAGVLTIANMLDPGSVEEDPRSANFGKIKIFGRWTDITGGMAPMVTLAMRLMPTMHDGEWGFWTKTASGYRKLNEPGYGKETALDVAENFFEGKFSPGLGIIRDLWKGQTFSGDPVTIEGILKGSTIPLGIQNFEQMKKDPGSSNILASMMLESVGFSSSPTSYPTNWNNSTSEELKQFKGKVGADTFKEANDSYNKQYNDWVKKISEDSRYKALPDESKQKVLSTAKDQIKTKIFKSYNFKYKEKKKKDTGEKRTIKSLMPN